MTSQPDEELWNYDTRFYASYYLKSNREHTLDWIVKNTVILHYCGKDKPWRSTKYNTFFLIYKHYDHIRKQNESRANLKIIQSD